ncbi:hypothetical protein F4861DRAFT_271085 [Xylaria intraflava]|nr:hypothetical protein F4861DRAFT_271085 [Xylaria intraflava]
MKPSDSDNHGLPYPLDSTIPGPPDLPRQRSKDKPLMMGDAGRAENPLAALRHMSTILLIDDSDSMQHCWDEVGDILRIIGPICIEYDPDGVHIEFVNHRASGYFLTDRSGYEHIGLMKGRLDMHDNVAGIYHSVKPKGRCRMDKRLASILDPYMNQYETLLRRSGGKRVLSPLNIIVISSMRWEPDGDDLVTLTRTARRLDILSAAQYQVGVQLFRVGDAVKGLDDDTVNFLDDLAWQERGVRDMVDTTTWTGKPGELSPAGTLKVLLGGVRRSIDFMKV